RGRCHGQVLRAGFGRFCHLRGDDRIAGRVSPRSAGTPSLDMSANADPRPDVPPYIAVLQARERWTPAEIAFWGFCCAAYFLFPKSLMFASQVLITGLFALSLDLILGYAGIVTLGHAAFFGLGAYAAGLLSTHGLQEPLTGLAIASIIAAL